MRISKLFELSITDRSADQQTDKTSIVIESRVSEIEFRLNIIDRKLWSMVKFLATDCIIHINHVQDKEKRSTMKIQKSSLLTMDIGQWKQYPSLYPI